MNTITQKTFKSSNFTIQSIIPLIFAFVYAIGFPVEVADEIITFVTATIATGVGFWGFIREKFSKGIEFQYNSNVLTYVVTFLAGFFPFLAEFDLVPAIDNFINAATSGDFSQIFAAVFVLGNIIYQIVQANNDSKVATT